MLIESVFVWLAQLSLLIGSLTDGLDHIESKSSLVDLPTNPDLTESQILLIGPSIDLNRIKSKSFSDNCYKSNDAKSKGVGGKEFEKDDLKGPK